MAFKQGKKPALRVPKADVRGFRGALFKAGYKPHTGLRVERPGEIQAWVRQIERGRQVHVQEVEGRGKIVRIFAHTEPAGETLGHLAAALFDRGRFLRRIQGLTERSSRCWLGSVAARSRLY